MHIILVSSVIIVIVAGVGLLCIAFLTRRERKFEQDHRKMIDAMSRAPHVPTPSDSFPRLYTSHGERSDLTVIDPIADYRARAMHEELAHLDVTAVYPATHPLANRAASPKGPHTKYGYDSTGFEATDESYVKPTEPAGPRWPRR